MKKVITFLIVIILLFFWMSCSPKVTSVHCTTTTGKDSVYYETTRFDERTKQQKKTDRNVILFIGLVSIIIVEEM